MSINKKKVFKRSLCTVLIVLGILVAVAGGYLAYVFIAYERVEDNIELGIDNSHIVDGQGVENAAVNTEYTILTNNIGYGALQKDYSFFMDGGEYSLGFSKDSVATALNAILSEVSLFSSDFMFFQEMDIDAKRSYHIDQYEMFKSYFNKSERYCSVFAVNYDCPYLFYPISEPIGKSKSGIATFSKFNIKEANRISLPIESGFKKMIDLDRCFSISRVDVQNGRELCLINLHLSAFTGAESTVRSRQVELLCRTIEEEYKKGNYVICGGDFNHDLLGNSTEVFPYEGEPVEWAQPFPLEALPTGFSVKAASNVPSCRNLEKAYTPGEQFVTVIDGFIISDNIECKYIENIDAGFEYSDHNPVVMKFRLIP